MPSAAARISVVGCHGFDAFDLGDDERVEAQIAGGCTHRGDVGRAFDKRLAHGIHAVLEGKLQAVPIVFGEGADAEFDAGQVEALCGAQFATDRDSAMHVVALDPVDDATGKGRR